MLTTRKRSGEIGTAATLAGVGLFLIFTAVRMPLGTAVLPGPGVMPLAIGLALTATSAVLVAVTLKRRKGVSEGVQCGSPDILVAVAGLVWTSLFFEVLGFFLCLGVFLLALVLQFRRQGWKKPLAFAVLAVASAYWFFAVLLDVPLPRGPF
jgi:putative tricarboxylic transport membrane protein